MQRNHAFISIYMQTVVPTQPMLHCALYSTHITIKCVGCKKISHANLLLSLLQRCCCVVYF